jgi:cAMP-binding proteins - catabolite gene activator and regulatory subunit of cAMP-dependent protein kinases
MHMNDSIAGQRNDLSRAYLSNTPKSFRSSSARDLKVVIPFAEHIMPNRAPSNHARRLLRQFHAITGAAALIRFRHRDTQDGKLVAEIDDYELAWKLLDPVQRRLFTQLSGTQQQLMVLLDKHIRQRLARPGFEHSFTIKDVEQWTGLSRRTVERNLKPLIDDGLITVDYPHGRNRAKHLALRENWNDILDDGKHFPPADEIRNQIELHEADQPHDDGAHLVGA